MKKIELDFEKMGGLVPAVVVDVATNEILMLAFQNAEAFEKTLATKEAHFWSRSRNEIWKKGATSGNVLKVVEIFADCDDDSILIKVQSDQNLKVCHTGARSCFFKKIA